MAPSVLSGARAVPFLRRVISRGPTFLSRLNVKSNFVGFGLSWNDKYLGVSLQINCENESNRNI